jgi:hypothetical protein
MAVGSRAASVPHSIKQMRITSGLDILRQQPQHLLAQVPQKLRASLALSETVPQRARKGIVGGWRGT